MDEYYFIDLADMAEDTLVPIAQREALEKLAAPWLPAGTKVLLRLVRSVFENGELADYVLFTENAVYFVLVRVEDAENYRYTMRSVKCFLANDFIAYAFLLENQPEIRLMLSAGKRIKLRLRTEGKNGLAVHSQSMQKLAGSRFLTGPGGQ